MEITQCVSFAGFGELEFRDYGDRWELVWPDGVIAAKARWKRRKRSFGEIVVQGWRVARYNGVVSVYNPHGVLVHQMSCPYSLQYMFDNEAGFHRRQLVQAMMGIKVPNDIIVAVVAEGKRLAMGGEA